MDRGVESMHGVFHVVGRCRRCRAPRPFQSARFMPALAGGAAEPRGPRDWAPQPQPGLGGRPCDLLPAEARRGQSSRREHCPTFQANRRPTLSREGFNRPDRRRSPVRAVPAGAVYPDARGLGRPSRGGNADSAVSRRFVRWQTLPSEGRQGLPSWQVLPSSRRDTGRRHTPPATGGDDSPPSPAPSRGGLGRRRREGGARPCAHSLP